MKTLSTFALFCLLVSPAVAGKAPKMKPGMWQTTVEMKITGAPMPIPTQPITTKACLTEKDLVPDMSQPGQNCSVASHKIKGNKVTWDLKCEDASGNKSEMSGSGKYKGDTFVGNMKMSMKHHGGPAMQMTYKISSKRLGPCTK